MSNEVGCKRSTPRDRKKRESGKARSGCGLRYIAIWADGVGVGVGPWTTQTAKDWIYRVVRFKWV